MVISIIIIKITAYFKNSHEKKKNLLSQQIEVLLYLFSDLHSSGHCISHSLRSDQLQNTDSKLLQETFGYSSDMSLPARCFYKPVDAQSADWTEQKPSIRDSPRPLPPVPQILY